MRLRTLVMELNRIEGDIRELEKTLREKREVKRKLWMQIMNHSDVKVLYWEYGQKLKRGLREILEDNGYEW